MLHSDFFVDHYTFDIQFQAFAGNRINPAPHILIFDLLLLLQLHPVHFDAHETTYNRLYRRLHDNQSDWVWGYSPEWSGDPTVELDNRTPRFPVL